MRFLVTSSSPVVASCAAARRAQQNMAGNIGASIGRGAQAGRASFMDLSSAGSVIAGGGARLAAWWPSVGACDFRMHCTLRILSAAVCADGPFNAWGQPTYTMLNTVGSTPALRSMLAAEPQEGPMDRALRLINAVPAPAPPCPWFVSGSLRAAASLAASHT